MAGGNNTHISIQIAATIKLNSNGNKLLSIRLENTLIAHRAVIRYASYYINIGIILREARVGLRNNIAAVVRSKPSPSVTERNINSRPGNKIVFVGIVITIAPLKRHIVLISKVENDIIFLLVITTYEITICSGTIIRLYIASATGDVRVTNVGAGGAD